MPVCGPAAFIVLKALAFGDRVEPKDAYDLLYVLRATVDAPSTITDRLVDHSVHHKGVVVRALSLLQRDFAGPGSLGPQRAAAFRDHQPRRT